MDKTKTCGDRTDTIIALHRTYIELYRHEDNLIWNKVKNFFYINALIISGYKVLPEEISLALMPFLGLLFSVSMLIPLYNSQRHIRYYRVRWIETERILNDEYNLDLKEIPDDSERNDKKTTSAAIIKLSQMTIVIWGLTLVKSVILS